MPLLSGVHYDVSSIETKWQWILAFNPMTAVISGWRWAVLDAPEPVWGQFALGTAVAAALFVGGLAVFRRAEPRLRGHDLMPTVIKAEGLAKRYTPRRAAGRVRDAARVARPRGTPSHGPRASP